MLALSGILAAVLSAGGDLSECVSDSVAVVEVNHVMRPGGDQALEQIIWWELIGDEYHVVDWRMIHRKSEKDIPRILPVYSHKRRRWVSQWFDEKTKRKRIVEAIGWRETWTIKDPEIEDRAWHEFRKGLTP